DHGECEHDHNHEHEHHHHHHHEDREECCCGHHHDHDHDECEHDHNHEHEHHHHADDIFTSWGRETTRAYSEDEIASALSALENENKFGFILRAKGIVQCTDGDWIHFDYVPGTPDIRRGSAGTIGRLCVIGSKINENEIAKVFMA
ncbi:MAG: GTP-binding protein, partial [Ruminococcus sp.]|nr:GTP-binding protein [Ruminococcus sp.]